MSAAQDAGVMPSAASRSAGTAFWRVRPRSSMQAPASAGSTGRKVSGMGPIVGPLAQVFETRVRGRMDGTAAFQRPMNADARPASLLSAEHLAFSHADAPVFERLSFTIEPGLTLVRGGDGRGKSTLLRLLAGMLAPTAGQLQLAAASVCFEQPEDALPDAVAARAWLAPRRAGFPAWQPARAAALTDAFGLAAHLDKPLYMLSN